MVMVVEKKDVMQFVTATKNNKFLFQKELNVIHLTLYYFLKQIQTNF
jgi:hypothetical protein